MLETLKQPRNSSTIDVRNFTTNIIPFCDVVKVVIKQEDIYSNQIYDV